MDQDLCSSKLAEVLFTLNEAVAQTIVSPDLRIEGELVGNEGMLRHDKEYLLQILTYLSSNSRAPWFIQRDSPLSTELFRLLQQNLSKKAKRLGIILKDIMFVKEEDMPSTLKIHER